ncbi:hypothetical protein V7S43_013452 [Phytophthora oleae]|uniref:PiggyBac transposable element-derived protein domain-containing protein n=1 Tax=Phytophthora oleae TaxID=2107226 RepID=A0ABD3F4M5_9STRA
MGCQRRTPPTLKKQRTTVSFAGVAGLIFSLPGGIWRCFDVESALTLVCVCKATHRALQTWFDAVIKDISLGKEPLPVPVQLPPPNIQSIVQLMAFAYTTVQLPAVRQAYRKYDIYLFLSEQRNTYWFACQVDSE